jgi:hypothetical protein
MVTNNGLHVLLLTSTVVAIIIVTELFRELFNDPWQGSCKHSLGLLRFSSF